MSGDPRFPHPKYVWSPSGGYWPRPRHWFRNTMFAAFIQFSIVYAAYLYTEPQEVCIILL